MWKREPTSHKGPPVSLLAHSLSYKVTLDPLFVVFIIYFETAGLRVQILFACWCCERTGHAVHCWLCKSEVMLSPKLVGCRQVGAAWQLPVGWERYSKEKGIEGPVWGRGKARPKYLGWRRHSVIHWDLTRFFSSRPCSSQYSFWSDADHELRQLVENGWCRNSIIGVGRSKRLGFFHSKCFRELLWKKKLSWSLSAAGSRDPASSFLLTVTAEESKGMHLMGFSHDAITSLVKRGRQMHYWCLTSYADCPSGRHSALCNPAAVFSKWTPTLEKARTSCSNEWGTNLVWHRYSLDKDLHRSNGKFTLNMGKHGNKICWLSAIAVWCDA